MPDYAKIKQKLDMKVQRQFMCKCVQAEIYVLFTAQRSIYGQKRE